MENITIQKIEICEGCKLITYAAIINDEALEGATYALYPDDNSSNAEALRVAMEDALQEGSVEETVFINPPKFANLNMALSSMITWVENLEYQIVGNRSLGEKLSWSNKYMAAKNHITRPNDPISGSLLAEAIYRNITVEDLANLIITTGENFEIISGVIAGLRYKTEMALRAVTDPQDYEVVLNNAALDAQAKLIELTSGGSN